MHLLIVEDDPALAEFLGRGLRLDGHRVSLAEDGEAALASAAGLRPDLMILDLGLSPMDGMEVLKKIAERFQSISVMVLMGRAEREERVKCLDLGADDVVLKPFSFQELRARLKALCRRRTRADEMVLRFGDLEMDRLDRRVTQSGRAVHLTSTEFSLLESLLRRNGERACGRVELLHEVWHAPEGMGTNIVEVYINYLRKKLGRAGRHAADRCVIRTLRGRGYVLERESASRKVPSSSPVQEFERIAG